MANNSVDTAELVSDSVTNSKLDTMEKRRVKVNATDATANPTDLFVDANQLLVGTSSTINAVSFSDDLALDNAGSTASKIIAAPSLIGGKSSVTAEAADEILIKDATDGALKRATAQSVVQSQVATTGTSGVVRVSDAAKLVNVSGAITADVVGITTGAPMMAKAWVEFTSSGSGAQTITNSFNITTLTKTGTGIYDIVFATDLPSDKYIALINGINSTGSDGGLQLMGRITARNSPTGSGCTVTFYQYGALDDKLDPDVIASLVFYGLTS